jgi:hypothetical protein
MRFNCDSIDDNNNSHTARNSRISDDPPPAMLTPPHYQRTSRPDGQTHDRPVTTETAGLAQGPTTFHRIHSDQATTSTSSPHLGNFIDLTHTPSTTTNKLLTPPYSATGNRKFAACNGTCAIVVIVGIVAIVRLVD